MTERPTTILHVDDDEANRYAVTRTLTKAGFHVIEAVDGLGAIREAARLPDLAILDIQLPDISGFEVCRRIKADPTTANIPVLHLSASYIRGKDKAQGLDGGADAYLVRPVEPIELLATVNALLRTRRTEEQLRQRERQLLLQSERLNAALAASNTGTFRYDYASRSFEEFDANLRQLGGLGDEEAVTLESVLAHVHPDDLPMFQEVISGRGNVPDGEAEFRAVLADGSTRWLFGRARLTRDERGVARYLVGACTDGTARKTAEEQVRQAGEERERLLARERAARAEAERAGRMKDEFLATLSHELRTPLSAILGWSQILGRGVATPEVLAEGVRTIERNARVQTQIIEDLLDMSRIISGKVSLDPQPIDLSDVVLAAIGTVHPTATAKGVAIRCDAPPDVGHPLRGDRNRLQQVFWNLLSNAIKFTPPGGTIVVQIAQRDGQWRVQVIDSGEGISPHFLPFVFDRFRQADASTTRRHGGLGLGLAIVKQLVELHGGGASVHSAGVGKGATFTVALPTGEPSGRADVDLDDVVAIEPASPTPVGADVSALPRADEPASELPCIANLRGITALLIDDEPDGRVMLKQLLSDFGATVLVAATADEVLAFVARDRPDVLISDIAMPDVDGYTLLRRVRALGADGGGAIPAIAMTAYARAEDRVRALRAGFQMHVPKPIEATELLTVVCSLLHRL